MCRLFPFDDAKIWRFFRRNKIFAVFRLSLLRQLRCFATNQRHSKESRRKSGERAIQGFILINDGRCNIPSAYAL